MILNHLKIDPSLKSRPSLKAHHSLKSRPSLNGRHGLKSYDGLKSDDGLKSLHRLETKDGTLKDAMTLIELLTVVFLGSLLMTLVFLLHSTTSKSYLSKDANLVMMLNLRSGMVAISRDIRMAGNGYELLGLDQSKFVQVYLKDEDGEATEWFKYPDDWFASSGDVRHGARPIFGKDGDQAPDQVTICSLAPDFATPLGRLSVDVTKSTTTLKLTETLDIPAGLNSKEVLAVGDYLALVPAAGDPILVEAQSDASDLESINIKKLPSEALPNGVTSIEAGSMVYNVKTVRLHSYRQDSAINELLMDSSDMIGDTLSEGIEDLQLAYCLGDDDPTDPASYVFDLSMYDLAAKPVKTAKFILVARTLIPDPYKGRFSHIPALNHTSVGAADSYYRRHLEATVQLRND
ncbi:MAG: PilW family protein [Deltaproteobacteria bacterium]|nr:PilW family protein [Deltaproteobacteria bacterium]